MGSGRFMRLSCKHALLPCKQALSPLVAPAKAGIHPSTAPAAAMDSRFRGDECDCEDVLSARWKSVPEPVAGSATEGNCVAARRGGKQPEVKRQSVG